MENQTDKRVPSRGLAIFLALFPLTGGLGLHLLYERKYAAGVVWLIASVLLSWTFVVPCVLMGIAIIQGIIYACYSEREWARKFENS